MKNLACTRVWWPNMDRKIEETVRKCLHCQDQRSEAAQAPVHPWEFPAKPWNRLHIDFAGPLHGFHWLVIVDARTKWPEVFSMKNATSQATINAISSVIARFGAPELVSDNGLQFTTTEFKPLPDVPTNQDISPQPKSPNPNLSRPPHADQTKLVHPSQRSERLNKGVAPKRLIEECQAELGFIKSGAKSVGVKKKSMSDVTLHQLDLTLNKHIVYSTLPKNIELGFIKSGAKSVGVKKKSMSDVTLHQLDLTLNKHIVYSTLPKNIVLED
ncbi:hypothetical protein J437_LFUL003270 [Ladona fulva]|uniref:RNA-directed DNA polymerase n=1 Tax=Ladona fulva TaxID=123851 RepID=A0A8K0K513_LADFU|nr:hypothetical protein J437_LFUL003270 [Ladona fulva]